MTLNHPTSLELVSLRQWEQTAPAANSCVLLVGDCGDSVTVHAAGCVPPTGWAVIVTFSPGRRLRVYWSHYATLPFGSFLEELRKKRIGGPSLGSLVTTSHIMIVLLPLVVRSAQEPRPHHSTSISQTQNVTCITTLQPSPRKPLMLHPSCSSLRLWLASYGVVPAHYHCSCSCST